MALMLPCRFDLSSLKPSMHFHSGFQQCERRGSFGINKSFVLPQFSRKFCQRAMVISSSSISLVAPHQGQTIFCFLAASAALAQILEAKTHWGQQISSPVLSMAFGMILSALQIIPSAAPAYDMVFTLLMPMAVSLTLLETDVRKAFTDAGPTLKAFWIGAAGTVIGTLLAFRLVGRYLGPDGWKIASCLCASYVGGSINYAATAQALELGSGTTLAAGIAADNLAMILYFGFIMSIPEKIDKQQQSSSLQETSSDQNDGPKATTESVIVSLATAAAACTLGNTLAAVLPSAFGGFGLALMAILASTFSALTARLCRSSGGTKVSVFAGSEVIGSALMLLFFSVVGASCTIREAVSAGWPLFAFILILIIIHLVVVLGFGSRYRLPLRAVLVASNANIGGPATAAAMANVRCWKELVRPAILVGTLGYTIGTVIGCVVGRMFLKMMF